jgi:dCMP deaminase
MPDRLPNEIIIAYVPVLHSGYIKFFEAFPAVRAVYLIDQQYLNQPEHEYMKKDIRMLRPTDAVKAVKGLSMFDTVKVLSPDDMQNIDQPGNHIVLPDEDISRAVADTIKDASIQFYGVFLRWDRSRVKGVNKTLDDSEPVSSSPRDITFMKRAMAEALDSTDIWRRVGAALVIDGKLRDTAHNQAEPHKYVPWLVGDPRNAFHRGVAIEMSVFAHAEAILIARAAKLGVSLQDASLYVTDFPCPACAKLIAHSGIKNLYYREGYAVLDGRSILDEHGVMITRLSLPDKGDPSPEVWMPYKKS